MRATVTLDDKLVADAREYTGIVKTSALVNAALTALVQREAAHKLARLGGSQPDLMYVPRRRFVIRRKGAKGIKPAREK